MFSFSTTLETLILKYSVFVDVPSPVCMKSLRTLHLVSVDFKDSESIRNLISGCPNLEDLVIHQCYREHVVVTFTIVAPFLKRLEITDYLGGSENGGYVINAPSLKYLSLEGVCDYGCCLIENVPMLVEAKITEVSAIANENILGSLKSAKRLFLDLSPLEFPTEVMYYQLVYLEMYTHKVEWWNLLTLMLDSSPKLQVLKLTDEYSSFRKHGLWNEPKNVPECLVSQLKMFVWTRYEWESEVEKEVATYILKNARQLKNASFSTKPMDSEERRKMLKEFDGVVRASSSCHLIAYPTGSIFYHLVSLEMNTRKEEWWNQPKYIPECLLCDLKMFVWTRYGWEREEEKEVATYILRNARQLNKATFSTNPIESKELHKLEKRRTMLNDLDAVDRASKSCHLVFEFDSSDMYKACYFSQLDLEGLTLDLDLEDGSTYIF
ncbi:PREDICTED: FBD-associated F-box protein At3g52670-like [Camelina sativa]|uniref:FBD-associated F-box protein At3g52670-like n=1 Tax=Camelina sativa TaxID=90675 RepID=A0ABM1QFN9_CAMSA|nr:PREDICTED: FBD-associated F-box protein At3g52670-like [Camelina sativa]